MKRILSFLLSVAMIISMLPAGAFASELETEPVAETQAVTEAATEAPAQPETEAAETEEETAETEAAETAAAETAPEETAEASEAPQETMAPTELPETEPPATEPTEVLPEETMAEEAAASATDDFLANIAAAEASGGNVVIPHYDEVILTEDLTINIAGELSVADNAKLVVSSGVTLTLNCSTIINGAELVVEEGGKLINNASLNVAAPMNTATFNMNGEFINNGQLWVTEGATVNLNGTTTSWYDAIHVGFGGTGTTSTLNVNGTMTTYGYLNVLDGGAYGVLNVNGTLILEKDENGNAYLQAANPVNVSGTLDCRAAVTIGNETGTAVLTVKEGGSLTVAEDSLWFDITGGSLVNNGTLTNYLYYICNYGTLTNNGILNNNGRIRNYATYTNNGTVNGKVPVDGEEDARNMFLDGISNAAASGENYTVWDEVTLTEDLTINMTGELSFADYSKLVVPSGVTLTLNGPTVINGATLVVEQGGKLISNASLTIVAPMNPATFDMNGEFVNNGALWVNEGATVNVNGTASSTGPIYVGFGGNGQTSFLNVGGILSTSGYLCISDSGAPGLLNVYQGATLHILNNENGCGYLDNTSRVQIAGTLNLDGLFSTGAAKDEGGNVVGRDASAEIRGTLVGTGTSSIGVGARGSVNVFGSLTTDGEVVVENESALWVDGTVTMSGPVTLVGALHVDFIDDIDGVGVLNLGGSANVSGYLAVHDGGSLYAGDGSVMHILNDESGCGYLDNQGYVNLAGEMYLEGIFTTGAAQDESGNVVGPNAEAVNNGIIEASATSSLGVLAGGTMYNNNSVTTYGELIVDGFWQGYPADQQTPSEEDKTMTFEEFKAALEDGDVALEAKVTIEEDLVMDSEVYIYEGGELVVPSGVTLKADAFISVTGGKLTVEEGGILINNYQVNVTDGGTLEVYGSYSADESDWLVTDGKSTIIGVEKSRISLSCYVDTEEDLRAAVAQTGYYQVDANIHLSVELTDDLTIGEDADVSVYGQLTVPSGVTLTVNGSMFVHNGGITVKPGGTLRISESADVELWSQGYLHAEGATVETATGRILVYLSNNCEILGMDTSKVDAICEVRTYQELCQAVGLCGQYNFVNIELWDTVTLEEDMTIPENSVVFLYTNDELVQMIIPQGVTVTNYGSIHLNYNSQIWIQAGGTLDSGNGDVEDYTGTGLIVEGTYIENTSGGGGEVQGGITSFEELKAAVEAGNYWLEITGTVTMTEDMMLDADVYIYEGGEIVVPAGVTLTTVYTYLQGGKLTVEAGGTLVNGNYISVEAGSTLEVNGTYSAGEYTYLYVNSDATVTGVDKSLISLECNAYTEEELQAAAAAQTEYQEVQVNLNESVELTGDLTIGENMRLWMYAALTVPSGVTLTVDGRIWVDEEGITLEPGATLRISEMGTVSVRSGYLHAEGANVETYPYCLYVDLTTGSEILGVDTSLISAVCEATTYEELCQAVGLCSLYNHVQIAVRGTITVEADLILPENSYFDVYSYDETVQLIIPEGVTVTNYSYVSIYGYGQVWVQAGGTLDSSRGNIDDNSGNGLLVEGTYIENTSGGGGSGDYDYGVITTFEDLVGWLNADMVPTYLYVWGEVTLEDDVTIPEDTQLIVEDSGNVLTVPSGVTVTMNGWMYARYGGSIVFQSGSELVCNEYAQAYEGGVLTFEAGSTLVNKGWVVADRDGTVNVYGTYVNSYYDENLIWQYETGDVNCPDMGYVYWMTDFADEAELQAILTEIAAVGYGQASVRLADEIGVVELSGNITIPENVYFDCGLYYGDGLVLKSGAVLTNYGTIYVYAPSTLTVEEGAELINHGEVYADEGALIYLGGGISIDADLRAIYGKGKATLTASITPEAFAGAKITWSLAEGDELYATLKGSGAKATLTAADVTGRQTVTVTASATLENGVEVTDTIEIDIIPLTKQITLYSDGANVTGQTILCDPNFVDSLELTAVTGPDDAMPMLAWASSNDAIATVENGRVVLTGKTGSVTITAAATDGSKVSAKVTISVTELVQSISLLSGDSELVGGKGTTLKVQDDAEPGVALAASAVTWALKNETDGAYVTVTAAGKVTTKAVPERISVTLRATVTDNPSAALEHTITIYPAVTQVDLYDGDTIYTGKTVKLSAGESIHLNASRYPVDSKGGVTWEVSDKTGKYVTVEADTGEYLCLKATGVKGTVTVKITSTDGSKKSATVKIQTGTYVSGITVTGEETLASGQSMQLTAAVQPANADNTAVAWSLADANDKQYVSVSSSGKVTAKKNLSMSKSVTILATAKDGSGAVGSFTFLLEPADPGALVILAEDGTNISGTTVNVNLLTGGDVKLKAKYFNTDSAEVVWSGKNVVFGPMDEAGYIPAHVSGKGTFTVTADDGNGKKATVKLKAAALSEQVVVSGPAEVSSGKSLTLTAIVLPEGQVADKKVTWWVDEADGEYAKISSSGKLTAAKNLTDVRSITVWAQAKDGNSEPAAYTVDILPLAQSVQILESGIDVTNTTYVWDLAVDEGNPNITAEVFAADASQTVVWKLSGAKVLEQNADGTFTVTGKSGTATVTATAADGSGKKASFKFTVVKSVAYIEQSQSQAIIAGGKSLKLASFLTVDEDATNRKLTWAMSGDTEAATLSTAGVLKTKKVTDVKTITVTATAADGSGCQAEFTVEVYPATTSVKLLCDGETAPKQADLGIGETLTLEGISLPTAAAQGPGAYTWKLSSDKFVTLEENPDGTVTVTGLSAGKVTVTCTAADGTGKKATMTIKVG